MVGCWETPIFYSQKFAIYILKQKQMADFKVLKPFILSWEGGFVNDPYDRGGATNKGVTISTFRHVFGQDKTVTELKNITDEQWNTIFKKTFWDKWKADEINSQALANILVDWVFGSGKYGITIPQQMLGVKVDGIIGNQTITALNSVDPKEFFDELKKRRVQYFNNICERTPTNKRFLKGWLRRLDSIGYDYLKYNNGKTYKF